MTSAGGDGGDDDDKGKDKDKANGGVVEGWELAFDLITCSADRH